MISENSPPNGKPTSNQRPIHTSPKSLVKSITPPSLNSSPGIPNLSPSSTPATNSSIQVLASDPPDPLSLDSIHNYFQRHYWDKRHATDQKHILENIPKLLHSETDLLNFQFKTTARDFQLIDDYSEPVLIPFGKEGRALCAALRETFDPADIRRLSRKLQRYAVNIPKPQHAELLRTGILLPLNEGRFHLLGSDIHYSRKFGLHPHTEITIPPSDSIL